MANATVLEARRGWHIVNTAADLPIPESPVDPFDTARSPLVEVYISKNIIPVGEYQIWPKKSPADKGEGWITVDPVTGKTHWPVMPYIKGWRLHEGAAELDAAADAEDAELKAAEEQKNAEAKAAKEAEKAAKAAEREAKAAEQKAQREANAKEKAEAKAAKEIEVAAAKTKREAEREAKKQAMEEERNKRLAEAAERKAKREAEKAAKAAQPVA